MNCESGRELASFLQRVHTAMFDSGGCDVYYGKKIDGVYFLVELDT